MTTPPFPIPPLVASGVLPSAPCAWEISPKLCDPDWDNYDPSIQDRAIAYASTTLWAATGRRFGLCQWVVRPCGRECESSGFGWNGQYWFDGVWFPFLFNGVWQNCVCTGACRCHPKNQVFLPRPVAWVMQVTVDGVVVNPSAYRVDNGMWLVRTDGNDWPLYQDYNLDSGVGTFEVTYLKGIPCPPALLNAAGELASQYAKGCVGGKCQLPARITQLVRQGVTLTAVNPDVLLNMGFTGLFTVDTVIRALNPGGLTHPMRIISPDDPIVRTVTQA